MHIHRDIWKGIERAIIGDELRPEADLGGRPAGSVLVLLSLHGVQDGHDPVLKRAVVGVGHQQVAHPVEAPPAQVRAPQMKVPRERGAQALHDRQHSMSHESLRAWTRLEVRCRLCLPQTRRKAGKGSGRASAAAGMYPHLDEVFFNPAGCGDHHIHQVVLRQEADVLADSRGDQVGREAQEDLCAHAVPVRCVCGLSIHSRLIAKPPC